jgi:hypothetical protein
MRQNNIKAWVTHAQLTKDGDVEISLELEGEYMEDDGMVYRIHTKTTTWDAARPVPEEVAKYDSFKRATGW